MSLLSTVKTRTRACISGCVRRLVGFAVRNYVAGPKFADALAFIDRLHRQGYPTTVGFWDGDQDTPLTVSQRYKNDVQSLGELPYDCYESIKVAAIGYSGDPLNNLLHHAGKAGIRIHFDSLAPDTAAETWRTIATAAASDCRVSASIPGRWQRSVADAETALALGVDVRVVKGQWADPQDPDADARAGFLRVIETLAGRAQHVAVATHDVELAEQALGRLQAAGTACELELLFGLPVRDCLHLAERLNVPVRFYVPYGEAYLPYSLAQVRKNPSVLWRLMKDSLRSLFSSSAVGDLKKSATPKKTEPSRDRQPVGASHRDA